MADVKKPNLEFGFRKIKSLNFLYEINENGTIVRNVKSKKHIRIVLDFHHSKIGYYFIFVNIKKKVYRCSVASLVAECWLGERPDGLEIDHIDRNPHNNHYSNLRYVTRSEQMKNRDHTNIATQGKKNLIAYIETIKKPILISKDDKTFMFPSKIECARFLAGIYDKKIEAIRAKLKKCRSHIYDYDIFYLNAETRHAHSKE